MMIDALGFVEVFGYVAALEAADAMLKTAAVRLLAVHELNPGMITIEVEGNLAACRVAVNAGRDAATRVGKVIAAHVIGRPDVDTEDMVLNHIPRSAGTPKSKKSAPPDISSTQRAPSAASEPVKPKPVRARVTVTHTTAAHASNTSPAPTKVKPARRKNAAPLPAEQAKRLKADKQGKALAQAARQWADALLGEMNELATAPPAQSSGESASATPRSSKGKPTAPKQ